MVTDRQVRRLMASLNDRHTLATAAARAGMDEKTARKYRTRGQLPSQCKTTHTWRTREDPFAEVWEELQQKLQINPGLQAKTLFQDLQRRYPGQFQDGQLRTLQRRLKRWRALHGPPKEVFFPQCYTPGERCQSDFTSMKALRVTIQRQPFDHLIYHFVLPYSNWETGRICFSETMESLSEGLQQALFELGGVPHLHQTDRLTAAVRKARAPEEFTDRYQALLRHYGMEALATQAGSPHENGDVEQRHYRFKEALAQQLMLRGSRDFESRGDYAAFLKRLFRQLNMGRAERFEVERCQLRRLPAKALPAYKRLEVRVAPSSTITVHRNLYSVPSQLIGERLRVRLFAERLEVYYAQRFIARMPRLRGVGKHQIDYRHVIDWLVRKPGAFAGYRYRADLFPTHRFRMAYDLLQARRPTAADKAYLRLLELAVYRGEATVDAVLKMLLRQGRVPTHSVVEALLDASDVLEPIGDVSIQAVCLAAYDTLLHTEVMPATCDRANVEVLQ